MLPHCKTIPVKLTTFKCSGAVNARRVWSGPCRPQKCCLPLFAHRYDRLLIVDRTAASSYKVQAMHLSSFKKANRTHFFSQLSIIVFYLIPGARLHYITLTIVPLTLLKALFIFVDRLQHDFWGVLYYIWHGAFLLTLGLVVSDDTYVEYPHV